MLNKPGKRPVPINIRHQVNLEKVDAIIMIIPDDERFGFTDLSKAIEDLNVRQFLYDYSEQIFAFLRTEGLIEVDTEFNLNHRMTAPGRVFKARGGFIAIQKAKEKKEFEDIEKKELELKKLRYDTLNAERSYRRANLALALSVLGVILAIVAILAKAFNWWI